MTALYLYAVIDRLDQHVARPALDNAITHTVIYQDIAAVVSPLTTIEARPTGANVWIHEAAVESLMADCAVLPARFGTVFSDEAAVNAFLAARYTAFQADLKRVRGRVEVGLRVLWGNSPSQPPAVERTGHQDGHTYMMARLKQERQILEWRQTAASLATEVHSRMVTLAVEHTHQILITPRLLLTAAYLVEQDSVASFQQAVQVLVTTYPQMRFLCTGPWPAYNFVTTHDSPLIDVNDSRTL